MRYSTILGIESSCDDTAVSVWKQGKILANITAGQQVHEQYGGVVPELASRAHQSHIVPVTDAALKAAGISIGEVDAIAFTLGPGLMGSLLVGINMAKGLAMALNKPMVGVDHLQAHVAALYIQTPAPAFPMLTLLVSGGHTQLVLVRSHMDMEVVGGTIDDAAGEAFDKAAKLMRLGYPGGPQIDMLAETGNPQAFRFPEARVPGLNMSFSGIKTSLLYLLRDEIGKNPEFLEQRLPDLCASYRHAVVHYLLAKTTEAIRIHKPSAIGLVGGVSANSLLRKSFWELGKKQGIPALIPDFEYCTDNAAMIATAGHYLLEAGITHGSDVLPFSRHSAV